MVLFAISIVFYAALLISAIIFLIRLMIRMKQADNPNSSACLVALGVIFTIAGPIIGFSRYDHYQPDIPFSKRYVLSVIAIVAISSVAFWTSWFLRKSAGPMTRIILSLFLFQGVILCAFTTVHFLSHVLLGLVYPVLGFELFSPLIALFLLLFMLVDLQRISFEQVPAVPHLDEPGFLPFRFWFFRWTVAQRLLFLLAAVAGLLVFESALFWLCGLPADSVIKSYTASHGFIFSN